MKAKRWMRRKWSARSASTWPKAARLRITRYPNLSEPQFFGCVAAFVDSLSGELNAATLALRRLQGQGKGRAFAYEMNLDQHRYGALIVIDRWNTVARSFGPHMTLSRRPAMFTEAASRVRTAEEILTRANAMLDAAGTYDEALVEAALMGFQSVDAIFREERAEAEEASKLGPMLSDDYREA